MTNPKHTPHPTNTTITPPQKTPQGAIFIAPNHLKTFARKTTKLTIHQLREYRRTLDQEEIRLAYWQKLLTERNHHILTNNLPQPALNPKHLTQSLGDTANETNRNHLQQLIPERALPHPPQLHTQWAKHTTHTNKIQTQKNITKTQRELTHYQNHLKQRRTLIIEEMLHRYHENPNLSHDLI